MKRSTPTTRASVSLVCVLLSGAAAGAGPDDPPRFNADDFPPSTAKPDFAVEVGGKVTVGGPGSANFLPDVWMDVFVVPHRTWRENDPLAAGAVKRVRVRSDAKGGLPPTDLWRPDKAGQFDIVVDYDGDGRFSYSLDALSSFTAIPPKPPAVAPPPRPAAPR